MKPSTKLMDALRRRSKGGSTAENVVVLMILIHYHDGKGTKVQTALFLHEAGTAEL